MVACPKMAWISDCCLLAAGKQKQKQKQWDSISDWQKRGGIMKTKLMAFFFLVHSWYVEIVAKMSEIGHQKSRYDQNLP
jgi:hypothetical protein